MELPDATAGSVRKPKERNRCLFFNSGLFIANRCCLWKSKAKHMPHFFLGVHLLEATIQEQVRVYLKNGAFRGVFLVLACISC